MIRFFSLLIAFSAAALGLIACSGNKVRTVVGCQHDSDCGEVTLWRCEAKTGICHCRNDGACPKGQFCNPAGFCQAKTTCYVNSDCAAGQICDVHANVCIPQGRCTTDDQCSVGTLCDHASGTCQPGCHSAGDCNLGNACLCTGPDGKPAPCQCDATAQADRDNCSIGQCSSTYCPGTDTCPDGDLCKGPDGGLPTCQSDYDPSLRPYCDACTPTPGQTSTCGAGPNFCLASTANGSFGGSYCGVDCSDGQACANGYHCSDVVVVRSIGCVRDSDCPSSNIPCQVDGGACPNDGVCQVPTGALTGFCAGTCYKHEGDTQGFCTCVADNDCVQDTCQQDGTCSISKRDCNPNAPSPCRAIHCVDFHGMGGCKIGQNCAPDEGLTCADVRPQH